MPDDKNNIWQEGMRHMKLDAYLRRLGWTGTPKADRETLTNLIHAHLASIPFENLNQQMGIPVSMDLEQIYDKVVHQKRGGWCFELNSLFAWALTEIGFTVTKLSARVGEDKPDPEIPGNHLLLQVDCEEPLLVDVGFGGGIYGPVPLHPCSLDHAPYTISISSQEDGYLKYSEIADGNEASYWFKQEPVEISHFEPENHRLQTDPNASFMRTLTAQRRLADRHLVLRGLVLKVIAKSGTSQHILSDEQAFANCLRNDFHLDIPDILSIWPKLKQRHEELFEG
jgi:N-hydroxyarylamine O-acetyltransferase